MKKYQHKISSLFLLGVFLLALLNTVMPHTHHDHNTDELLTFFAEHDHHSHTHEGHEHNENSDDHHNHSDDEHQHEYHFHELPLSTKASISNVTISVAALPVAVAQVEYTERLKGVPKEKPCFKRVYYRSPHFTSTPLRGPPSIA